MSLPPSIKNKKTFAISDWEGHKEGEKIIVYGESGIGKTTLAALSPDSVFIGVDDGGRKMPHPVTGKPLKCVPGITSFADVRDALRQPNLFKEYKTVVIDNITELERWGLIYTFNTVPKQNKQKAINVEDYGYHHGYRYWYDSMRLILQDCDPLMRAGINILMVAQSTTIKIANPGGEDFLKEGPELYHDKNISTFNSYISWVDHVFRISYTFVDVSKEHKAASSQERAVFVHPEIHYTAKSRTLPDKYKVVSFKNAQDDSIWKFLFGDKK